MLGTRAARKPTPALVRRRGRAHVPRYTPGGTGCGAGGATLDPPMMVLAGPIHAAAAVVVLAALAKAVRPAATGVALRTIGLPGSRVAVRALAAVELAVAAAALTGLAGGRPGAAALAALHLGFASAAASLRARAATCGCFGEATPVTGVHVAANVVVAAVALAGAAAGDVASVGAAVGATPAAGVPYVVLAVTLAVAEGACLTALAGAQVEASRVRGQAGAAA